MWQSQLEGIASKNSIKVRGLPASEEGTAIGIVVMVMVVRVGRRRWILVIEIALIALVRRTLRRPGRRIAGIDRLRVAFVWRRRRWRIRRWRRIGRSVSCPCTKFRKQKRKLETIGKVEIEDFGGRIVKLMNLGEDSLVGELCGNSDSLGLRGWVRQWWEEMVVLVF